MTSSQSEESLDVGFVFGSRIALPGKAPVQPELSVFSYGANDADIDHQRLQTSPSLIGKRATSCSPEAVVGGDDDMMAIQVVDEVADQRRQFVNVRRTASNVCPSVLPSWPIASTVLW
jgi:hypothetical protein